MVEAIPAGCEICISYIRTFCRFVKIFFIQINSFPFFVQFEIFTTKFSKLTSICYIFANGKCAWVLNFAQDQSWPDHFCSRSFRQQLLQEKFGFSCSCIKCRWDSPRSCVHQTLFYPADVSSTYTYPSILGYFCKSYLTRVFNHPLTPFHQSCWPFISTCTTCSYWWRSLNVICLSWVILGQYKMMCNINGWSVVRIVFVVYLLMIELVLNIFFAQQMLRKFLPSKNPGSKVCDKFCGLNRCEHFVADSLASSCRRTTGWGRRWSPQY